MKRLEQWLGKYGVVMRPEEVAKELRMHPTHIRELCRDGKLPATQIVGRWLIDTERLIMKIENG